MNRFNRLAKPYFHQAAESILGDERESFFERYKFSLQPATDDRPHFFHFFKWSALPEILSLRDRGGLPLLEGGYLVLAATFVQALIASVILILLPLFFTRKEKRLAQTVSKRQVGLYFSAVVLGLLYIFTTEIIFAQFISLPAMVKTPITLLMIAPLAFFMGMPFPLALAKLGDIAPDMIPWAWGVNGCASVVSAVLATLLAIHFGFNMVILLALLLYGLVWFSFPEKRDVG